MKFISLGQYRTPLYFNGSDSYSSVTGGFLTLILYVILMIFGVMVIVSILRHENWIIEEHEVEMTGFKKLNGSGELTCESCEFQTLEQLTTMIFKNSTYFVTFPPTISDCGTPNISVIFTTKDDKKIPIDFD